MGCFVFTVYPSIGEAQTTGINKTGTVPLEPSWKVEEGKAIGPSYTWKVEGGRGKVGGHETLSNGITNTPTTPTLSNGIITYDTPTTLGVPLGKVGGHQPVVIQEEMRQVTSTLQKS